MRVRIAHVDLPDLDAAPDLFDHAVERHLAWILGIGPADELLTELALARNYHLWVAYSPEEDADKAWIAVRQDLINEDTWAESADRISFESSFVPLGYVDLRVDQEGENWTNDDRIKSTEVADPVLIDDYMYTEVLFRVTARD